MIAVIVEGSGRVHMSLLNVLIDTVQVLKMLPRGA